MFQADLNSFRQTFNMAVLNDSVIICTTLIGDGECPVLARLIKSRPTKVTVSSVINKPVIAPLVRELASSMFLMPGHRLARGVWGMRTSIVWSQPD